MTSQEGGALKIEVAKARKVVVAVHGIGDQYHNATIQTVVAAIGKLTGYPAVAPLGSFHSVKTFTLKGPNLPKQLEELAFVEVYWADIPRQVQKEGYIIEESKAWARTLVNRLRSRFDDDRTLVAAEGPAGERLNLSLRSRDYLAASRVIGEMVETFAVLDNLFFLAAKAGLVRFDLDTLLTQYLGDVQIVAEFNDYRRNILDKFKQVLDDIHSANDEAEIYLVAHSEGTVVALMGLLEAMCIPQPNGAEAGTGQPSPWVNQLRGLMTFGSPIDKHLILWPEIWTAVEKPHPDLARLVSEKQIKWRNYYDYGDPVGFALDSARGWMKPRGWDRFFEFAGPEHDYGFSRYLLPGAAHIDYWRDDHVFGHFFLTVLGLEIPKDAPRYALPLRDRPFRPTICTVLPYLLVFALIYLATYLLYKAMVAWGEGGAPSFGNIARNVGGIAALLGGMIALARIPRLTRSRAWFRWAVLLFTAGAALYGWLVDAEVHSWHALQRFDRGSYLHTLIVNRMWEKTHSSLQRWHLGAGAASAAFIIFLSAAICLFAVWGSRRRLHRWTVGFRALLRPYFIGARPLVYPGMIWVITIIGYRVCWQYGHQKPTASLWPLLLASAAFLYLWWLATLLFDLVFVWHRYIRHSVVHKYLYVLQRSPAKTATTPS